MRGTRANYNDSKMFAKGLAGKRVLNRAQGFRDGKRG